MNNKVMLELRRGSRYEKPNQMRKRKASEAHRRRFADMIRQKVKLVSSSLSLLPGLRRSANVSDWGDDADGCMRSLIRIQVMDLKNRGG